MFQDISPPPFVASPQQLEREIAWVSLIPFDKEGNQGMECVGSRGSVTYLRGKFGKELWLCCSGLVLLGAHLPAASIP